MSFEQLLNDIKKKAADNNVNMILSDLETLDYGDGTQVNGYFLGDNEKRELAVAMGKEQKEWLPVFIHEACHMDQFLEDAKVWTDLDSISEDEDAITILFNWIAGDEYPMELIEEAARLSMLLELDCEIRTTEKIKQYNLDINVEDYIKMSNCYVLFYKYIVKRRTWYAPGKSPFHNDKVWTIFPSTFDIDYTAELSEEYAKAYDLSYI